MDPENTAHSITLASWADTLDHLALSRFWLSLGVFHRLTISPNPTKLLFLCSMPLHMPFLLTSCPSTTFHHMSSHLYSREG